MCKKEFILYLLVFLIGALFVAELQAAPYKVWEKRYSGPSGLLDEAFVVSVNTNRNVFVTGWSAVTSANRDIITMRYNPDNGDTVWVKRFEGGADDRPLAMTSDNSFVYVTGWSFTGTNRDIVTIKYNAATGDSVWTRKYNGPGSGGDYGFAICIDASGNVYAAGRTDVGGAQKFIVLKYDAAGSLPAGWPAIYSSGVSNYFDEAHSVAVDGSGNVYVTGLTRTSAGTTTQDFLTLKINSSGIVQWAKKYNGNSNLEDKAEGLVLDASGNNVFVAGYGFIVATHQDYITIKYNSSGDSVAAAVYQSTYNLNDVATAIVRDDNGNIYVTGYSGGLSSIYNYATVSYDANLAQRWVTRYVGPGNSFPYAIAYSQGFVYVTGSSVGSGTGLDYLTARYNASTGAESWTIRENGGTSGDDNAYGIAILDSASVFVTGSAVYSPPFGTDFLTIRYSEPIGIRPISSNVPSQFELMQNYPNPFNPSTKIRFNIPKSSFARLSVFDVTGREIEVLANENLRAGEYEAAWDASGISSGVYFYRLSAGDFTQTRKMALVK